MGMLVVKLSLVSKYKLWEFPDIFTRNPRKQSLLLLVIPMSDHASPSLSLLALALGQPVAAGGVEGSWGHHVAFSGQFLLL